MGERAVKKLKQVLLRPRLKLKIKKFIMMHRAMHQMPQIARPGGHTKSSSQHSRPWTFGKKGELAWKSSSRGNLARIIFGKNIRITLGEISTGVMIQRMNKTTKPAAQEETNLIAISTSLIPMSAKGEGKKALRSRRGRKPLPSLSRIRSKGSLNPKGSGGGRKKFPFSLFPYKSQKYY